jgi:hypothetical protein
MQKAILTLLGSVLLVATVTQAASANERHARRVACACAPAPAPVLAQQFRDSSGTVWTAEPGWSPVAGYYSHAFAAPAGH